MVVVVIMAIISAVAIPALVEYRGKSKSGGPSLPQAQSKPVAKPKPKGRPRFR